MEFARNIKQANEAVQELLIQMQTLYRKHRMIYKLEDSLKTIISISEFANEPESKGACAWIIGEFGEFIPKAADLMKE